MLDRFDIDFSIATVVSGDKFFRKRDTPQAVVKHLMAKQKSGAINDFRTDESYRQIVDSFIDKEFEELRAQTETHAAIVENILTGNRQYILRGMQVNYNSGTKHPGRGQLKFVGYDKLPAKVLEAEQDWRKAAINARDAGYEGSIIVGAPGMTPYGAASHTVVELLNGDPSLNHDMLEAVDALEISGMSFLRHITKDLASSMQIGKAGASNSKGPARAGTSYSQLELRAEEVASPHEIRAQLRCCHDNKKVTVTSNYRQLARTVRILGGDAIKRVYQNVAS